VSLEVVELPQSTRTAKDAAAAVGCEVAQIAKSLVFRGERTGTPLLVIASGVNRVDTAKLAELAGEPVAMPDADYVRAQTGFSIGGIPPVGHDNPLSTIIDADLMKLDRIWAAAGTPNAVFALTPGELLALTEGRIGAVARHLAPDKAS
jgi:prolyl-tRNA editing enzyme YbaK/EbsC (Cys-tRNA(Pro) deacylase)